MEEKTEKKLCIIVPCYNEESSLSFFFPEIRKVADEIHSQFSISTEYIFVNDGSKDGTIDILREEARKDESVHYYSFSRNFGKEAAIYAGLCNANADYIAVMDADLQDPPALLLQMMEKISSSDYDCVAARRVNRDGEPVIRSYFAHLFYKIINIISDVNIMDGARDFRVMKKKMVDAIVSMNEYNRFSKGIFGWVGFQTCWIPYENVERVAGGTKWSFWRLFQYAIDGIINFSEVPLRVASWLGFGFTVFSFIMLVFIVVRRLVFGDPVAGWASTVCVIIFIGGVQLFSVGLMGQYIAKIYAEVKHRPHFVIAESNIGGKDAE